jgi:hypothetical protein
VIQNGVCGKRSVYSFGCQNIEMPVPSLFIVQDHTGAPQGRRLGGARLVRYVDFNRVDPR